MCLHLRGLENKSRKQEHSCTQRWARAWRRSQPLTQIKATDERKSLNPDQWKTAAVLLGLKSPHPLFLLIGTRAELLMNELHQWKSFKTHCFALLHMLITSAEDVDAFLCFLQSGRTCKLDVCARGRRGSDFIWLDAIIEPKFLLSDASASSQRSSNIPAESGISQPKMEVVEEGKHGFSIQGRSRTCTSQMKRAWVGPGGFLMHVSMIGVAFRCSTRMSPGTRTTSNIFEVPWTEPRSQTLLSKPLT